MKAEMICVATEPPICIPSSYEIEPVLTDGIFGNDDEPLLANEQLSLSLKAADPPGCLLCLLDELGEED